MSSTSVPHICPSFSCGFDAIPCLLSSCRKSFTSSSLPTFMVNPTVSSPAMKKYNGMLRSMPIFIGSSMYAFTASMSLPFTTALSDSSSICLYFESLKSAFSEMDFMSAFTTTVAFAGITF